MTRLALRRSRGAAWLGSMAVLSIFAAEPAVAQQNIMDPFAGSAAPGAPGPYGSAAGATVHLMQSMQTMLSGMTQMLSAMLPGGMASPTGGTAQESGSESGDSAEAPEAFDADEDLWEIFVGACAGGAFLGGYSAATAHGAGSRDRRGRAGGCHGCRFGSRNRLWPRRRNRCRHLGLYRRLALDPALEAAFAMRAARRLPSREALPKRAAPQATEGVISRSGGYAVVARSSHIP